MIEEIAVAGCQKAPLVGFRQLGRRAFRNWLRNGGWAACSNAIISVYRPLPPVLRSYSISMPRCAAAVSIIFSIAISEWRLPVRARRTEIDSAMDKHGSPDFSSRYRSIAAARAAFSIEGILVILGRHVRVRPPQQPKALTERNHACRERSHREFCDSGYGFLARFTDRPFCQTYVALVDRQGVSRGE